MGIWESVTELVKGGKLAVEDASILIRAALGAHADVKAGKDPIEALKAQAPNVMPVIESIVSLLFPGATVASLAVGAVGYMLLHSHAMTQEEQNRWMDLASQSVGQGGG